MGLRWGPFTARIPFVHTKFLLPEFLQGLVVGAATGLALVPLLTNFFGLTFEEAVAMSMLHFFLIASALMLFGEPYSPGWITPALPFTLAFVLSEQFPGAADKFQAMTALAIDLAAVLLILGITGLGAKLNRLVPDVLKGGIILGAALAAFLKVLDFEDKTNVFSTQTYAAVVALVVSLILAFSEPLEKLKQRRAWVARLASLGLFPGLLLAALVGYMAGEIQYDITWGILVPPFTSLWEKVSPFYIGWPSLELYLQCLPLALITYIIVFGDLVTGEAIVKEAGRDRPDELVEINHTRSHLALSIRNFVMGIIAPFFPTQGPLWTGVQVVILQRWRQGRNQGRSLFDGMSSYYIWGLPLMYFLLPMVTALKPLMDIALMMTLLLTGFACAHVALMRVSTMAERGVVLLTAVALTLFEPWQGVLAGAVFTLLLVDLSGKGKEPSVAPEKNAESTPQQ
ncbi:MAG: hypothetical protein ACR2PT_03045 [Endozoicomonas sp.]